MSQLSESIASRIVYYAYYHILDFRTVRLVCTNFYKYIDELMKNRKYIILFLHSYTDKMDIITFLERNKKFVNKMSSIYIPTTHPILYDSPNLAIIETIQKYVSKECYILFTDKRLDNFLLVKNKIHGHKELQICCNTTNIFPLDGFTFICTSCLDIENGDQGNFLPGYKRDRPYFDGRIYCKHCNQITIGDRNSECMSCFGTAHNYYDSDSDADSDADSIL